MVDYSNYPEYEMFEQELNRKKDKLTEIMEEYEKLQQRVKGMQGYEQIEAYIGKMQQTYDILDAAVETTNAYKNKLVSNPIDIN